MTLAGTDLRFMRKNYEVSLNAETFLLLNKG